jgi:hypothetical protein
MLFVAIVWAVASSYVAIQMVLQRGLGFVLAHPSWFGSVGLSAAARDSRTCSPDGARTAEPAADVDAVAWMLGLRVGRDAIARQYASVDADVLAAQWQDAAKLAAMAGVPAPSRFVPKHAVNANIEFVAYVESQENATARALATAHSGASCHLFKLGALWGYASMVRPALAGEHTLFSAEIRHHAQGLIPDELTRPMVDRPPAHTTADAIFRADSMTTQRITTLLSTPR